MECHNGGIFHASSTILEKLEGVHYKFLRDIDVDPVNAFLKYNFCSPEPSSEYWHSGNVPQACLRIEPSDDAGIITVLL